MAKKAKKEVENVAAGDTLQVSAKELAALARPFSFFRGGLIPDFHVYLMGKQVVLMASNQACRLARTVVTATSVEVTRDGIVGVEVFSKTLSSLSGMVDLKIADGKLVVSQESKRYSLTALEGEKVKFTDSKGKGITINGQTFKRMLGVAAANCSTDFLRPAMNGIRLVVDNGKLEAWGTDGHRMVVYRTPIESCTLDVLVPAEVARLAVSLAGESVRVYTGEGIVGFEFENGKLEAATISEQYPNAQVVMTAALQSATAAVVVASEDLRAALRMARGFAPFKSPTVCIRVRDGVGEVLTGDVDFGVHMKQRFGTEGASDALLLALNGQYLSGAFDLLLDEKVVLKFDPTDNTKPIELKPFESGEDLQMLIMPVRFKEIIAGMGPDLAKELVEEEVAA